MNTNIDTPAEITSKRLDILNASLAKKKALFDSKLQNHYDTVKQANGQPLNDKRNGSATLNKWDKQNEALRTLDKSIEITKAAIEREEFKVANVASVELPTYIKAFMDSGDLIQWRKYPNIFFVNGVDKARIKLLPNNILCHMYVKEVVCKEQYAKFRDIFNKLNKDSKE
jgi:hypothetical protein